MKAKVPIKKIQKAQFNTRIPSNFVQNTRIIAAALGWRIEDITIVAFSTMFGSTDEVIAAKRKKIEETARQFNLSFNAADAQPVSLAA